MTEPKPANKVPAFRRKSVLILSALLLSIIIFGTTTQTWLYSTADQGAVKTADIAIQGSKAATAVTALAVVAIAGSLAASISGRVIRIVAGCVVLLAAIGIDIAVITVLLNPQAAAAGPVGAQIGLTGISLSVTLTAMIWIALVAGVLLIFSALAILVLGRKWPGSKKYDNYRTTPASQSAEPVDDIDSWDRLSRGEDPTSGTIEDSSADHSNQEKS
ncbi:Trp biosynthesis-associated membrane protein [Psychromicrobium lacuslunae]|uniref:Trp biosynthesis-associated membrane protein n=1 Tax=Psychromicrobium lacuslunae TaxID=1618207 RepID=UPI0005D33BAB|nr:Trp biosynthesis-associated membrane protein [Psychromicrobium lacuslunae]